MNYALLSGVCNIMRFLKYLRTQLIFVFSPIKYLIQIVKMTISHRCTMLSCTKCENAIESPWTEVHSGCVQIMADWDQAVPKSESMFWCVCTSAEFNFRDLLWLLSLPFMYHNSNLCLLPLIVEDYGIVWASGEDRAPSRPRQGIEKTCLWVPRKTQMCLLANQTFTILLNSSLQLNSSLPASSLYIPSQSPLPILPPHFPHNLCCCGSRLSATLPSWLLLGC